MSVGCKSVANAAYQFELAGSRCFTAGRYFFLYISGIELYAGYLSDKIYAEKNCFRYAIFGIKLTENFMRRTMKPIERTELVFAREFCTEFRKNAMKRLRGDWHPRVNVYIL